VFDHWNCLNGNPLEEGSKVNTIVMDIRKRKGLKLVLPPLDEYLDKL
jgi:elongation factor 2